MLKLSFTIAITLTFLGVNLYAITDCTDGIKQFLKNVAPNTEKVVVNGNYTKKSKAGDFKACELSVKAQDQNLKLDFTHQMFNPGYGDGGAFWPFGSYPTVELESDQYRNLNFFQCNADQNGFYIDYSYTNQSGWYETKRYTFSLLKNSMGGFDASLRDGDPRSKSVTCRGSITEK